METKLPLREIEVKIKTKNFEKEYQISYPNTGQLFDIELLKIQLAKNNYGELVSVGTASSKYARYTIDMIATFSVLIPELKKNMGVLTISELHPLDAKILLKVYLKTVLPWLQEWFNVLNTEDEIEE